MKTTIKFITATVLATMFISLISMAQIEDNEEGYIDDIPFNTHEVAFAASFDRDLANFTFEEEAYVDDIPFNTETIANDVCCDRELIQKYAFEEEAYVDDIPFDTYEIARQTLPEEEAVPMTYNCDKKKANTIL